MQHEDVVAIDATIADGIQRGEDSVVGRIPHEQADVFRVGAKRDQSFERRAAVGEGIVRPRPCAGDRFGQSLKIDRYALTHIRSGISSNTDIVTTTSMGKS